MSLTPTRRLSQEVGRNFSSVRDKLLASADSYLQLFSATYSRSRGLVEQFVRTRKEEESKTLTDRMEDHFERDCSVLNVLYCVVIFATGNLCDLISTLASFIFPGVASAVVFAFAPFVASAVVEVFISTVISSIALDFYPIVFFIVSSVFDLVFFSVVVFVFVLADLWQSASGYFKGEHAKRVNELGEAFLGIVKPQMEILEEVLQACGDLTEMLQVVDPRGTSMGQDELHWMLDRVSKLKEVGKKVLIEFDDLTKQLAMVPKEKEKLEGLIKQMERIVDNREMESELEQFREEYNLRKDPRMVKQTP